MAGTMWLVEADPRRISTGLVETIRWGSHGIRSKPTDSPADVYFVPALISPPTFSRHIFSSGSTFTNRSAIGAGEGVVAFDTTFASWFTDYDWPGAAVRFSRIPEGKHVADAQRWLTAFMEQPGWTTKKLVLNLLDRQSELDRAIQETTYLGDGDVNGVQGRAEDIGGLPIPLCYGNCLNVPAVLVNASKLIYQVHDGPVDTILAVYDSGAALTFSGTDHADSATMIAALQPAAGTYDTCIAEGFIRIGAPTVHQRVTVDLKGDKTGGVYVESAADIIERIVTTRGGWTSGDFVTGTVSALNTKNNAPCGLFIDKQFNIRRALDWLMGTVGGGWVIRRDGKMLLGRVEAPAGSPTQTFKEYEIGVGDEPKLIQSGDKNYGMPTWGVRVHYARHWVTQEESELAGSVADSRRNELKTETRKVESINSTVQSDYPTSPIMEVDSLFRFKSDAQAEALRVRQFWEVLRRRWRVPVPMSRAEEREPFDEIALDAPHFNWSGGADFIVTGIDEIARQEISTMEVLG